MHIENGKIIKTNLGVEDHGIMTCWIELSFDGTGQAFGGYALDSYSREKQCRIGDSRSIMAIRKILEVVDVQNWEDLNGKYVRIKRKDSWGKINAIGHIIKDQWFSFEEHYKKDEHVSSIG